ncbi:MAG: aminotransferase class I/II-fold pyridoxal phosphate-dependent enzyme [Pyrinomonadaceae bacterium]
MSIAPSGRIANFRYAIRNVVAAADALRQAGREIISLNIGDPQAFGFMPPDFVIEPVERAMRDGFTGYASSAGLYEAREAVAEYGSNTGIATSVDDVIMTAGASEAADLVLTALLDPGDEVLLPAPGYPLYDAILNKLGAMPRYYKLHDTAGWQPDVAEVTGLVTPRTRAIVLINPSNPTGAIIPDETTTKLLDIAARHNLLVITDEVYRDLCFEQPPTAAAVLAKDMDIPVITLESLSKTHMLSGWRVGWMRFTNSERMPRLIEAINRLASGRLCSPTPAQYAVRPALTSGKDYIDGFMREIEVRRDLSVRRVSGIEGISCTVPQSAFYLMVRVEDLGGRIDEQFALELLQETGVLVVHGSGFGTAPGEGYFRMVYLADQSTLDQAFDGISRVVGKSVVAASRPGQKPDRSALSL